MSTLAKPTPCPRCGTSPIAIGTFSEPDRWAPACTCYPHPPLCISCRAELVDEACNAQGCPTPYVIQPDPIVDPLWGDL